MRASKGAGRPSALAINPSNREASATRRARLLAAFNELPEDDRADLLEDIETIAFRATSPANIEFRDARCIIRQMYGIAGFEPDR